MPPIVTPSLRSRCDEPRSGVRVEAVETAPYEYMANYGYADGNWAVVQRGEGLQRE